MAAEDITGKDTVLKGVNSPNNYVRSVAHLIDGTEHAGILAMDTHDLFRIPKGNMLKELTVLALGDTTSSGAATIQFKAKTGAAAEAVNSTALAIADLAKGDAVALPVEKIKAYDPENDIIIQMTVGTAALTAIRILIVAEFLPVAEFMTAG